MRKIAARRYMMFSQGIQVDHTGSRVRGKIVREFPIRLFMEPPRLPFCSSVFSGEQRWLLKQGIGGAQG